MPKKKTVVFLLKGVISVSLITFLLSKVDWDTVAKSLQHASYPLLVLAFLLNICERFELAFKWNLLVGARGITVKFFRIFLINSIGSFLGLFLPSSVGTDVMRGYYLMKNNDEKAVSISSVFVDRLMGLCSLVLFGFIAVLLAEDLVAKFNLKLYITLLLISVILAIYILQQNWVVSWLHKLQGLTKFNTVLGHAVKLHSTIVEYKKHPKTLAIAFLITLMVQLTRIMTYYAIAKAFGVNIHIIYFFLFVPLIMIAMMLPISIGGIGVREGTFVAFFSLVGMPIDDAIIISFSNSLIDMLNTLVIGGGAYLFYKSPSTVNPDPKNNLAPPNESRIL